MSKVLQFISGSSNFTRTLSNACVICFCLAVKPVEGRAELALSDLCFLVVWDFRVCWRTCFSSVAGEMGAPTVSTALHIQMTNKIIHLRKVRMTPLL